MRFINDSIYGTDKLFQSDRWLFRLKVNNYQLVSIFWNIALMIVPWLIGKLMIDLWRKTHYRGIWVKLFAFFLFLLWLLFIPNTAYVISEVRHLLDYCPRDSAFQVCEKNAWMSIFFFIYASLGWVFFVFLVNQMRGLISEIWNRLVGWLFVIVLIPLVSLGLLVGLLNRWNSWEFFLYPASFLKTLPIYWQDQLYFTNWLYFTIFLYVLYGGGQWLFKERFK